MCEVFPERKLMVTDRPSRRAPEGDHHLRVAVLANDQRVIFELLIAPGARIKAVVIRSGVPIQEDFVLSEVLEHGKQRIVRDTDEVRLKDGDEFWAIPGGDKS